MKLYLAFFMLLCSGLVSACISYPAFEGSNCNLTFNKEFKNMSYVSGILKSKCGLDENKTAVASDFVKNGYSVVEQTQEEYDVFLEVANEENIARPGCEKYIAVSHNSGLTGYIDTGSIFLNGKCMYPNRCGIGYSNIIWNDLLVLDCKELYWTDNENSNCEKKKFCGAYMYQGLQTFETREECEDFLVPEKMCNKGNCSSACPGEIVEGKCYKNLSNGNRFEIKIMPDNASDRAIERLGELGFDIQLREIGEKNNFRFNYEASAGKRGKLLAIFPVKADLKIYIDAETGEIIKINKPWWSFLATNIKNEF